MIVGLVGVSIVSYAQYAKIIAPLPVHPSFMGFLLAIASLIVVSLMTPAPSEKLLDETMTGLYIRRKEDSAGRPQGRAAKDVIKASNKLSDKI